MIYHLWSTAGEELYSINKHLDIGVSILQILVYLTLLPVIVFTILFLFSFTKTRDREVKKLEQDHTASPLQSWNGGPGHLDPESMIHLLFMKHLSCALGLAVEIRIHSNMAPSF